MPLWIAKNLILISLFLSVLFLSGCDIPDPNPELKDPIYMDIQKQEQNTISELKSQESALELAKIELSKVQPQTGQVKRAQQQVFEIEARIVKIKQTLLFLTLRKKSRELADRESYSKAFYSKTPWPDPKEAIEYKIQQRAGAASRQWNVKQRILDASIDLDKKKSPGQSKKPDQKTGSTEAVPATGSP